ncbi:hypothetical protein, partial [Streptococcus massiliensis]
WDSLSKWFIVQFYFTKTIATMQKSNGFAVAFFGDKGLLSQALFCLSLLGGRVVCPSSAICIIFCSTSRT